MIFTNPEHLMPDVATEGTGKPDCTCMDIYPGQGHHHTCPVASYISERDGGYQPCSQGGDDV